MRDGGSGARVNGCQSQVGSNAMVDVIMLLDVYIN